jgi:hypothetical protein
MFKSKKESNFLSFFNFAGKRFDMSGIWIKLWRNNVLKLTRFSVKIVKKSTFGHNGHNFPLIEPKCYYLGVLERSYHVKFEKKKLTKKF